MSNMLRKKEVFTAITPIPGFIPRQLAIDILHSHSEVITLNPLVLSHKAIPAPRDAASDEFYSTWYEITERIQYIPGMGKMGSGKISFNGCFHDMPWGLQTHIYAPMNVDLRNKYRIAGNQPGVEPPEQLEIGMSQLGVPADGLYLREDIEIKCNIAVVGFVKSQLQKASKEMVQRIIKKAELLDAGVLRAMIHDGKLKTFNPNDRSNAPGSSHGAGGGSGVMRTPSMAPSMAPSNYNPPLSPRLNYSGTIGQGQSPQGYYQGMRTPPPQGTGGYPAPYNQQQTQQAQAPEYPSGPIEMPGDYYHAQASPSYPPVQNSPTFPHQQNRDSQMSNQSSHMSHMSMQMDPRWSDNTQRTSMTSQGSGGYASPGLDHKGFAAELPSHPETQEEHRPYNGHMPAPLKLDPPPKAGYPYNPQSYQQNVR